MKYFKHIKLKTIKLPRQTKNKSMKAYKHQILSFLFYSYILVVLKSL